MTDSPATLAGAGLAWIGAAALRGGKGYADCALGQVHYRVLGDDPRTPFLLIHQTPFGMAEYVDVQPALIRGGRRSIVSDNPGYGFSDPPPESVSVADLAGNLAGLLDHLGVAKAIVVGHHTGAAIAAAFAARHSARTAGVILHGCPLYTAAEGAERLARPGPNLALEPDGSHLADNFRRICGHAGSDPRNLVSATWAVLGAFLGGPKSPTYKAVFANDMAPDIAAIRAPALVLTDAGDTLHGSDAKVAALRPDFGFRQFSRGASFSLLQEPQRFAAELLEFARAQGL